MLKKNKTTPKNVKEAHEALFYARMNLPDAAKHCGMTQKELKMTFFLSFSFFSVLPAKQKLTVKFL